VLHVDSSREHAALLAWNIVGFPSATVEKIGSPYQPVVIPAVTYYGQTEDVETAAVGNFLITHDGVSEETVYQMTKLLFENLDRLAASHAAAKAIDPKKALDGMPVPLHPGAERYYKEVGVMQ